MKTPQQEVMEKMKLEPGSYVDIVRRVNTERLSWVPAMNKAVGKTFRVAEVKPLGVTLRDYESDYNWVFPTECLVASDEEFDRILNEGKTMTLHEAAVKALDLKLGDTVKVGFAVPSRFGGWDNTWSTTMNSSIGKICKVNEIPDDIDIGIRLEDGQSYTSCYYPAFCLEKVTSETICLNSEYSAVVHADKVVVGCQTIPLEKVKEIVSIMKKLGADLD